jgi:HEAT repeat protein
MPNFMRILALFLLLSSPLAAQSPDKTSSLTEDRIRTIQYGITSEIISLIDNLRSENNYEFDSQLAALFSVNANEKVRTALLNYFTVSKSSSIRTQVLDLVKAYDDQPVSIVLLSLGYLAEIGETSHTEVMQRLLEENSEKLLQAGVKAAGLSGNTAMVKKLVELYEDIDTTVPVKQEILIAFGRLKSADSLEKLLVIAKDPDSDMLLRTSACTALGEMDNPEGIKVMMDIYDDSDTLLRNAIISALVKVKSVNVEEMFIRALKDDYWRIRSAALKALGERKVVSAISIMIYKAEKDPENTIKIEALKAIGSLGTAEAGAFLAKTYEDEKIDPALRIIALNSLNSFNFGVYKASVEKVLDKEWPKKTSPLLEQTASALSKVQSADLLGLYEKMLQSANISVKASALAGIKKNKMTALKDKVKALSEDKASGIQKLALSVLESLN